VHTADCGPVALVADGGAVAVAHAGWKGLVDGVVEATVTQLRELAPGPIRALVGVHIGVECYEFGAEDLAKVVDRLGPAVAGRTSEGTPALDLGRGIHETLTREHVEEIISYPYCTACETDDFFSHRARQDVGRQAVLAWIE
jgi:copper oxidase (laccase) domain-containing protein